MICWQVIGQLRLGCRYSVDNEESPSECVDSRRYVLDSTSAAGDELEVAEFAATRVLLAVVYPILCKVRFEIEQRALRIQVAFSIVVTDHRTTILGTSFPQSRLFCRPATY